MRPSTGWQLWIRVVGGLCAGLAVAATAQAEPFVTRNQHPLLTLYGLPSPLPARLPAPGRTGFTGAINWSNTATTDTASANSYTIDAEVLELRLHFDRQLFERAALHVELPWRRVSAGSLDGIIDQWHDLLGLPNGSRDRLPEDQLLIEYRDATGVPLRIDDSSSGIGDLPVAFGYQLHASERRALSGWLTVKAPTGSADELTGSGTVDVALSLAGQAQIAERWQLFGQANVAWLGEGDLLPDLQEDYAWSAMGGVTWNAWRGLDLTVQLEANSAVFDTGTDIDGDAVVLTFGGSYRTSGGWRFDVGVSEDVEVGASPDVNFNIVVRRGYP